MNREMPTLLELAEQRIADAKPRDKTINIKIAIGTARMIVEAEKRERGDIQAALLLAADLAEDWYLHQSGTTRGNWKRPTWTALRESIASQTIVEMIGSERERRIVAAQAVQSTLISSGNSTAADRDRLAAEVADLTAQHDRMKEANSRLAKANVTLVGKIKTLRAALQELSDMYGHTWDLVDGGLMMMDQGIPRFERAHAAALAALADTAPDKDTTS